MFESYAPKYIENSYFVTPLNGKIPFLMEWQKPLDPNNYEKLYAKHAKCNIGLLTGAPSGVIALDIDKMEALKLCPPSPIVKRGQKGETRFFKYTGEVNQKNLTVGLEILSTGNQTVLPPSIHPETKKPYVWQGQSLLDFDRDDLPILPSEFIAKYFGAGSGPGLDSGRHNALITICFARIGRGEGFKETVDELIKYDKEAHHSHPRGPYFDDKTEPHGGLGRVVAEDMVRSCTKTVGQRIKPTAPIQINFETSAPLVTQEFISKQNKITMPEPHGIIKDVYEYVLSISNKPRPKFAMASALAFIGTVLSNRVKLNRSTPNLYQILITESGEGKDVPLKTPKNIFMECGLQELVGMETYRSDKTVVDDLPMQRQRLDTVDEISKVFKSLKSNQSHSSNIAEMITELWGSSLSYFPGFKSQGITVGACFNPCVSIIAATTPSSFQNHFTVEQIMQGFGARFLFIFDDDRVKARRVKELPIPDSIIQFAEFWKNRPIDKQMVPAEGLGLFSVDLKTKGRLVISEIDRPIVADCHITAQAEAALDECMDYYDELAQGKNGCNRAIINRCYQQIEKIAIISAVSRKPKMLTPMVDEIDIKFARDYVDACLEMTTLFLQEHLPQSKFHGDTAKVLKIIRESGSKGIPRTLLTRKASDRFGLNRDQLHNKDRGIIAQLLEQEYIGIIKKEGTTRPTEIYVALKDQK